MIDTKDIVKMVTHITRRDRGIADPQIMHPMREWLTGIAVTLIVVTGGVVFAAVMYHSYDTEMQIDVVAPQAPTPYKQAIVERALAEYRLKRTVYENTVGKKAVVAPSVASSTLPAAEIPTTESSSTLDVEFPDAEVSDTEVTSPDTSESTTVVVPDLAI